MLELYTLRKDIAVNPHDLGLDNGFLGMASRSTSNNRKNSELCLIKI